MASESDDKALAVFKPDTDGRAGFEDLGRMNGVRYWTEPDLMASLGCQNAQAFRRVVARAMQACLSLGIQTEENFSLDGPFYRLTRFACYLVAMNGDSKKPHVAAAQVYFAHIAESFQKQLQGAGGIDRLLIREEMADGQKALQGTAHRHGVENYAFFLNAGYRGMYNMSLKRLEKFKNLPPGERLLDRMGKDELAANLFRVTQTDAKIRNENIHGQVSLERAAETVGTRVRKAMQELSGTAPEHLSLAEPIRDVRKSSRETNRGFRRLDGPKKLKAKAAKKGPQSVAVREGVALASRAPTA